MEFGLVALWLVVYLALLLAGLPLAATLFPRLADRGAGVAIPLSAAILWVVAYWVGHVSLSLALWVGLLVLLAAVVAVVYVREPDVDTRIVGETVAVFTVAFCFLIAVRAVDPAVHPLGGEKFLDFGLLQSLLRANTLPPEDMWFAGEPVKYYYGGHLLASLLTRLTGTAPRFAYNLALAGFYAMLVTAAYGLAGSLAADRGSPRVLAGLFGAFFVGLASNLRPAIAFVVWLLPGGLGGFVAGLFSLESKGLALGTTEFSYWHASRIIDGTINEFPFFSWLNGDLHAHMMSTPFLLLAAALLFSYFRTPESAIRRRRLLVLGIVPPLAGLLAVVNTWSFPSVGGLTLLAVLLAPADPTTLLPQRVGRRLRNTGSWARDEFGRFVTAASVAGAVVLLGLLWSAPFWLGTATGRSIGLFPERSTLMPLVVVHGVFLLVFVPYLLRHGLPHIEDGAKAAVMLLLVVLIALLSKAPAALLFAPMIGVGWALLRITNQPDAPGPGPTPAVATADGGDEAPAESSTAGAEAADDTVTADDPDESEETERLRDRPGFELVLLLAGAGLVLLVELAYVKEDAGPGRFNTVFKTYMQVWVLWAVAAGAIVTHLVGQHRPKLALSGRRWRLGFAAVASLLVVSTSLYAGLALQDHFTSGNTIARVDDPTLDGTAFVETHHPEEAPAIRWLDANVDGQPNIVSAPGGYQWNSDQGKGASAPSSLTGIPTVVGWFHEIGYRGQDAYRTRTADVRTIYAGQSAEQARLLRAYDVEYIYVGPAERATYGRPTFAGMDGISVAKQWDAVTIYRVDQRALDTETN